MSWLHETNLYFHDAWSCMLDNFEIKTFCGLNTSLWSFSFSAVLGEFWRRSDTGLFLFVIDWAPLIKNAVKTDHYQTLNYPSRPFLHPVLIKMSPFNVAPCLRPEVMVSLTDHAPVLDWERKGRVGAVSSSKLVAFGLLLLSSVINPPPSPPLW